MLCDLIGLDADGGRDLIEIRLRVDFH